MKIYIKFFKLTLLLLALLLVGCASNPSKFYVLNSIANHAPKRNAQIKYHIGLEKIQLAYYLQRPQIVTRQTNNRLFIDEFNRWAEPLQRNVQQTIRTNLLHLLPSATVTNYPWKASDKKDLVIKINIQKFEANYKNQCVLQVNYEISNNTNKIIYAVRNKIFTTQVDPKNYDSIVVGMNQNLNLLSRDIIRNL